MNTGVGSLSLIQGTFLNQESNWGLLPCRWIIYQLSYQGSQMTNTFTFFHLTYMLCAVVSWSGMSDSLRPHGLYPARLLPVFQARILEWVAMPTAGHLPNGGNELMSPAVQVNSLPSEPPGKSKNAVVGIYPFSKVTSRTRNWTGVSCIADGFFTSWATRKACNLRKCRVPSTYR